MVTRVSFEFLKITTLPKSCNPSFLRVFAGYHFFGKLLRMRPFGSGCDPFCQNKLGKLLVNPRKVVTRVSVEFLTITTLPKSGNQQKIEGNSGYHFLVTTYYHEVMAKRGAQRNAKGNIPSDLSAAKPCLAEEPAG